MTVNSWTIPPMKCGTPVPSVTSPSADIVVPVGTKQAATYSPGVSSTTARP